MKIIAFIPVRGGSKSIPLKNIKPFCGKPLVCWNIEALENCPLVDEIIVATDSVEIENTVLAQTYQKQPFIIAYPRMLVIQPVQKVSCLSILAMLSLLKMIYLY